MADDTAPLKILDNTYLHKREAGFTIPLYQSLATGGFSAAIVLLLMLMYGSIQWRSMFYWTMMVFLVVTFIMWMVLLYNWFILSIERFTGRDINGDGVVGPVIGEEIIHPVRIDVIQGNATDRVFYANGKQLADVADAVLSGVPFSQRRLSHILSRSEFERMRDELKERFLLEERDPKNPEQGYQLNERGIAMFRDIADRPEGFY